MTTQVGGTVESAAKFLAAILAMIAGLTKNLTGKMSLTVGGKTMNQAAILAQLAAIKALWDNVTAAKNGVITAVAAKNAGSQAAKQFMADLKKAVEGQFGSNGPQLPDFGIALPKPKAARTVTEMAASVGLSTQTRAVRGTMGKAQKAKVTVAGKPGVVIVGPNGEPLAGVKVGAPIPPAALPVAAATALSAAPAAAAGSTPVGTPTGPAGSTVSSPALAGNGTPVTGK